jgi:aspartyl protease family protein
MDNEFETASAIYLSILLLFFAIGMIRYGRAALFQKFKFLLVWALILLLVVAAYAYWPDVKGSKLYASLVPGAAITKNQGEMEFRKAGDGHFYINAVVNGQEIRFMVDSGATDIVLSQKDAKKLGIEANDLNYNKIYFTANGTTRGASVRISYLKIGDYEMHDFYASVTEGRLEKSLLGMAFLSRFASYRVEGDRLIITK